jgi:hypothetical protein
MTSARRVAHGWQGSAPRYLGAVPNHRIRPSVADANQAIAAAISTNPRRFIAPHSIRHIDRAARPQVRIERTSITTRPRLANYRRMARVRLSACPSESLSTTTVGCSTAPVGRPLHGLAGRWGASPHGGDATINASSCTTPPG